MKKLLILFIFLFPISSSGKETYSVEANCYGGKIHGNYKLVSPEGVTKISGKFKDGRKNGIFDVKSSLGFRIAYIPYVDDEISGKFRMWATNTAIKKLESDFKYDFQSGVHRSWYPDGKKRTDAIVLKGKYISGSAWNGYGEKLKAKALIKHVEYSLQVDAKYIKAIENIINSNLIRCK